MDQQGETAKTGKWCDSAAGGSGMDQPLAQSLLQAA